MPRSPHTAAPGASTTHRIGSDIDGYYQLHARIYDATRWTFLFGRDAIIDLIARHQPSPESILEVGCGTGRNLAQLAHRFPHAQITGLDLSSAMLAQARHKVEDWENRIDLMQRAYDAPIRARGFDVVLCSYALTMFNPGFEQAIEAASRDLAPGGLFALVDFHGTRLNWFERWMAMNHVRMNGQLRPLLRTTFKPVDDLLRSAYGGAWSYLLFVGCARS